MSAHHKNVILSKLLNVLTQDTNKENKQVINNAKNDKGKNRFKTSWEAFTMASKGAEMADGIKQQDSTLVMTPAIHNQDRFATIFGNVKQKTKRSTPQQNATADTKNGNQKLPA